jgi:hypothetical protein
VVTVLLLPSLPAGRPVADPGLLARVAAALAARRIVGTRIEVAAPTYVPVTVRATVAASPGGGAGLSASVRATLVAFFDPLTGGSAGAGWPFGRDVYRAEVLSVVAGVPGVAHVVELELVTATGTATCGDLCVGPTGLVASGTHEIAVR